MAEKISGIWRTGVAISMQSASAAASVKSSTRSITPKPIASLSDAMLRPTPITSPTAPACLSLSATEPPIRPTPTITIFSIFNMQTQALERQLRPKWLPKPVDAGVFTFYDPSAVCSAAKNLAFSSFVPIEIRK